MDTFSAPDPSHQWSPQPQAAALVRQMVDGFLASSPSAQKLAERMRDLTGTRLADWIDHLALPASAETESQLRQVGFQRSGGDVTRVWTHPGGMFPAVVIRPGDDRREMAIKVESVPDFLFVNGLEGVAIEGEPLAPLRRARFASDGRSMLSALERHGTRAFEPVAAPSRDAAASILAHGEAFLRRRRHFPVSPEGYAHARSLIDAAIRDVGIDRAADLFFAAERAFWMSRNRAAQTPQKTRQDRLGLGWANQDHHTYRSSREAFAPLIAVFEGLGVLCRERFYAGDAAGWGAQVLEQPVAGIVVFADVDLSPEEVAGDFAHKPLAPRDRLGTVGLWCLHGEAFLEAGMHHLECQFDFDAEREQLKATGVGSMKPFTLFPYLKQAFTEAEVWAVDPERITRLRRENLISEEQAERFRREGAVGSHLEVLQRDDGYKGFNQSGISDIIRRTDPRAATATGKPPVDTAA